MGSTFRVSDNESTWMPNSGTFEITLQQIALKLRPDNATLAAKFEEPVGGFPYLNLSDLNTREFNHVLSSVQDIFIQAFEAWGANPEVDNYYFLSSLSELKALLLLDPRAVPLKIDTQIIHFSRDMSWSAPGWVYDLVLGDLVAWAFKKGSDELVNILLPCWSDISAECDLSEVATSEFQTLFVGIKRMWGWYHESGDGRGKLSYAPAFLVPFVPKVIELYEVACADDRVNGLDDDEQWFIDQVRG